MLATIENALSHGKAYVDSVKGQRRSWLAGTEHPSHADVSVVDSAMLVIHRCCFIIDFPHHRHASLDGMFTLAQQVQRSQRKSGMHTHT